MLVKDEATRLHARAALLADVSLTTSAVATRFASPAALQRVLEQYARKILNRVGVPMVSYQVGIRYARSLSRPFRKFHGPELARELERHMDHWASIGMERGLAELLTVGVYQALTGRNAEASLG